MNSSPIRNAPNVAEKDRGEAGAVLPGNAPRNQLTLLPKAVIKLVTVRNSTTTFTKGFLKDLERRSFASLNP
jgi:hypothetical protein